MAIELIAIVSPAPGKADRLVSLVLAHAEYVKQNEPGTVKYQLYKQTDGSDLVLFEAYMDEATMNAHTDDAKFIELRQIITDEGLLAKSPQGLKLKAAGGFMSKL